MVKQYAVISAARSGSTYLAEWLFGYLRQHHGYRRALMEYFTGNPARMRWQYRNREIIETSPHTPSTIKQRVQWLKDSPHRYLVKHRGDHETDIRYFSQCHVIVPYRRNVLQQVLSYGLSKHTHTWYATKTVDWKNLKLNYPPQTFKAIAREIAITVKLARTLPNVTLIAYEDFVRDQNLLLDKLGLERRGFANRPTSVKMNHHHESNFVNLDQVRLWCAEINDAAHRFR